MVQRTQNAKIVNNLPRDECDIKVIGQIYEKLTFIIQICFTGV